MIGGLAFQIDCQANYRDVCLTGIGVGLGAAGGLLLGHLVGSGLAGETWQVVLPSSRAAP